MGLEEAIDAAADKVEAEEISDETEQVASDEGSTRKQSSNDSQAATDGTPDNFISYLQEKGVEGNKLEQAQRYYSQAQEAKAAKVELAELREEVDSLKGRDALEDFLREEYSATYSDLDEMLETKSPREVYKMIVADLKAQANGDAPEPKAEKPDAKVSELEKKIEKLQDEIFEQKMDKEISSALDDLGVEGRDRQLLREYVDERWYLAPPKMEMKDFVKKCHKKFNDIRGTQKKEEGPEAEQEPEKASEPKKPVAKKPKSKAYREPRYKGVGDLFEGKGNALDKALDKVLGSGAS